MKKLALLLLFSQAAFGELFVFGVKGGIPMTDTIESVSSAKLSLASATRRYTIGPMAELRLPFGFGVEADILYKRSNLELVDNRPDGASTRQTSASCWEFPLLGKFRLPGTVARPYVAAGVSFRKLSDLKDFVTGADPSSRGFVVAGGIEFRVVFMRLAPELRYTRWGAESNGAADELLRHNRNQAEFLIGITF